MSNYVAPEGKQQTTMQPPARRYTVDPGQIFVEPRTSQQPAIDYLRQAIGFNIKYAALSLILAILAYSLAARTGHNFTFGTVLFAGLSLAGYWALGFMENVFEPTSGHVVRSFFGWLVLREDIQSHERIQYMYWKAEWMRLQNERIEAENVRLQIRAQVERHSLVQSELNRLSNYELQDEDEEPSPEFMLEQTTDEARAILLGFLGDLYRHRDECVKSDGNLKKGIVAPWTDSADCPAPTKRQMLDLLNQVEPRLFRQHGTRPWQLNVEDYPTIDEAIAAINEAKTRLV